MSLRLDGYPFCAVVGQERAKKALLLHAVNPLLKGVLLAGAPGTAKSTLIRGIAELLPERRRVDIPLSVDEDRLMGGLDVAAALRRGERRTAPGLLAEADGQIVTVDNAGLMPGRWMNMILNAAENGYCEREENGLSAHWPSRFLLFGALCSGEEGPEGTEGLAPVRLDRWGLFVRLEPLAIPSERAEIASRLWAFERDPAAFRRKFESETVELRERVAAARKRISRVDVSEQVLRLAAEIAGEARCPGHRADILLVETARTIVAWEGGDETAFRHVREAADYVLPHRMKEAAEPSGRAEGDSPLPDKKLPDKQRSGPEPVGQELASPEPDSRERAGHKWAGHDLNRHEPSSHEWAAHDANGRDLASQESAGHELADHELAGHERGNHDLERPGDNGSASGNDALPGSPSPTVMEAAGGKIDVRPFVFTPPPALSRSRAGKRNPAGTGSSAGRYVRAAPPRGPLRDLAFDATLRNAAPYQRLRRARRGADGGRLAVWIEPGDIRVKVRESRTGTALLFVVDASGSMNAGKRMKAVKGAVLSLLRDAYRKRDSVGLIAFREKGAELLLGLTRSVELAERKLRTLPTGGRTPLSAGLTKALETIRPVLNKGSGRIPAMIVITDGKANAGMGSGLDPWQESRIIARRIAAAGVRAMVIDTEEGFLRLGFARQLADDLQGQYCRLEALQADRIERAVRTLI